jgi:hypothetical protein
MKLDEVLAAIAKGDFHTAKRLFKEFFYGVTAGERSDPGMAGSRPKPQPKPA